jgi:Arc/MetJ-type ribon-helix-helix transcriptional regulator
MNVEIPSGLYKKLEERIKGSEFSTVSDYVSFVLTELLKAEESGGEKEDDSRVKERLRSLGYLD